MNHPTREELTDYLYQDLPALRHDEVRTHLNACDECRGIVASWQEVRGALRAWTIANGPQVAEPARRSTAAWSVAKWAVAASVFITCGFALARLTAAPP